MDSFKKQLTIFLSRKINYKRFNDDSTMHGFKEFYYASKIFWKILWFIIIAASIALTVYQVAKATQQFIEQPTITTIQPLEEGNLLYPPFSICYKHWSFWVDLEKVKNFNISKSVLHFGLSFADKIFSQRTFNVNNSEENFSLLMQRNNWTYLSEFYSAISKDYPGTLSGQYEITFTEKGFREVTESYFLFCYTINGSYLADMIKSQPSMLYKSRAKVLELKMEKYPAPTFSKYLTQDEYYAYVKEDLEQKDNYTIELTKSDLEELYNPHFLQPNLNLDPIELNSDIDIYRIKFRANVHKWQNRNSVNCIKGEITNSADQSCKSMCSYNMLLKGCKLGPLFALIPLKLDTLQMACRDNIEFMDKQIHFEDSSNSNVPDEMESIIANCQCDSDVLETIENETFSCIHKCTDGCEKWDFDFNVIEKTDRHSKNNQIRISVEYASEDTILVISEIDSQSWETYIANVGGLLGIWLGASIVSFIQTIYLCCFSEPGENECDEVVIQNFDKGKTEQLTLNGLH